MLSSYYATHFELLKISERYIHCRLQLSKEQNMFNSCYLNPSYCEIFRQISAMGTELEEDYAKLTETEFYEPRSVEISMDKEIEEIERINSKLELIEKIKAVQEESEYMEFILSLSGAGTQAV